MHQSPAPHRPPTGRLLTGALALALGLATGTAPAQAADPASPDRTDLVAATVRPDGDLEPAKVPASALHPRTLRRVGGDAPSSSSSGTDRLAATTVKPAAATASAQCDALGLQSNQLRDRTWLVWDPTKASGTLTVTRLREGSATWRTVGTAPASAGALLDGAQNPAGPAAYRITGTIGGVTSTCDLVDEDGLPVTGLSMFPDAGPGFPDFAVSTTATASLQMQNDASLSTPVNPASAPARTSAPAFSADGQWVAFSRWNATGSAADLMVQRADGRGPATVLAATTATAPVVTEPTYSPDGRRLAWARYTVDAAGDLVPVDIQVRDLWTGAVRSLPARFGSPVWDRTSTSLVAVDLAPTTTAGLVTINASTGAVAPLSGTAGGYDPTVTRDGRVVFVTYTGDAASGRSTIKVRSTAGSVTAPYQAAPGAVVYNPRMTRDGADLYFRMDTNPDLQPGTADDASAVYVLRRSASQAVPTALGAVAADPTAGALSFDLRQASGKGTTDLSGDGANDLLAKDAGGTLWLYPNTGVDGAPLATRTQVGNGWNIYDTLLAAGDWSGDGIGDVMARDPKGGLWFYPGLGNGRLGARVYTGGGWGAYVPLAVGDWDEDGAADLLARDSAGTMWLYRGTGRAHATGTFFAGRTSIGSGWLQFNALTAVGDADYDNNVDLLTRSTSGGALRLYGGRGVAGGPSAGRLMPTTGQTSFNAVQRFVGPERYSSYATSLVTIDSQGVMKDQLFTGDGDLAWPASQVRIAGGAMAYAWMG